MSKSAPLSTSFRYIITMAIPLIIGSLGHNIISATDTLVIGHYGHSDAETAINLSAIGLAAPLYLLLTMIGLAFSRGGQILIARKLGEGQTHFVGRLAQNMVYAELCFAVLFFIIIRFGGWGILYVFIKDPAILAAAWAFLSYRIWGIFFGFIGIAFIALYSGVGRTQIIIINAIVLASVNIALNYGLVFGKWGFHEMGISGAALASVVAEGCGLFVFIVYVLLDPKSKAYGLFKFPPIDTPLIISQIKLSAPIALQSFFGMGSWFLFFSLIEKMGSDYLATTNAVRVLYMFLGVPAWGLSSATNTIVSSLIGQNKREEVFRTIGKISIVSVAFSALVSSSLLFFPKTLLHLTTDSTHLIEFAQPIMPLLFGVLMVIAVAQMFYNGIVGTGAIRISLSLQAVAVFAYIVYAYSIIHLFPHNLVAAWSSEFVYFFVLLVGAISYMSTDRWHSIRLVDFDGDDHPHDPDGNSPDTLDTAGIARTTAFAKMSATPIEPTTPI